MAVQKGNAYCAIGHCGVSPLGWTEEGRALNEILCGDTASINDGYNLGYQQTTPKARVLAALRDKL